MDLTDLIQDRDRWRARKCGNEPSGRINIRGNSGLAETRLASQERLCSMELVCR